jgi:UPF0176 protein
MLPILNIAGYRFTRLKNLAFLRDTFLHLCESNQLKGTILLSEEGINISMSGVKANVEAFIIALNSMDTFSDIPFHKTYSQEATFKRLKVKIKKEIITFRQPAIDSQKRAPSISPEALKQWLDENRDFTLLDTRNDYEIEYGTFEKAMNLHLKDFTDFPEKIKEVPKDKPIVMFCTGGIRCEKAALYMMQEGYENVHQLDTGILGYFAKVGGAHYAGDCFVFDERVTVDPELRCKK